MADIIRLHGSQHEQVEALLPWYASGTLDDTDRALVDAHLAGCDECRAALATERKLARAVASLPVDIEQGWSAMADRLEPRPAPVPLWRRRVPIGWAVGTPIAAAASVAFAFTAIPAAQVAPTYVALGAPTKAQPGNILLIFKSETTDRAMRAALDKAGARIVGGPNASGAYIVSVAPDRRAAALTGLRASPDLVLAEPIDASATP